MIRPTMQLSPDQARPQRQRQTGADSIVHPTRFSGLGGKALAGSSDGLISLFQKITEIYLVGFLALDVVALWITRIIKGAERGAEKYDAGKDPSNEGLPPTAVLRKSFRKNLQGLNWKNATEEALREMITGPSGFVVPALTFSFALRKFGKNAVEIGYGPLGQLKDTFAKHLEQSGHNGAQKLTPAQFKTEYRNFLRGILKGDADMLSKTIDLPGKANGKTYAQYIDQWTDRWVKTAAPSLEKDLGVAERKNIRAALEKLNVEFEETVVKGYNRKLRLEDRLYQYNDITAKLADKAGDIKASEQPIDALLSNLTRFKDFAREVAKAAEDKVGEKSGGTLSEITEAVYRRLVGKKVFFAGLATLAASMFLYVVPRISQRNKEYPANRLFMEGAGEAGADNKNSGGNEPKMADAVPSQQEEDALAQLLQSIQQQEAAASQAPTAAPAAAPTPFAPQQQPTFPQPAFAQPAFYQQPLPPYPPAPPTPSFSTGGQLS